MAFYTFIFPPLSIFLSPWPLMLSDRVFLNFRATLVVELFYAQKRRMAGF